MDERTDSTWSCREIQEVRNAIAAYDRIDGWQPESEQDLLAAHRLLMQGLIDEAGIYRRGGVGEALQSALGLQDRKSFRERYLKPALAEELVEMTLPDKPNSRLQKYRLTEKGRRLPRSR